MGIPNLHDLPSEAQQIHENKNRGFNDFPPNWQELTAAEFAKSTFFGWHPEMFEHRQMLNREDRTHPMVGATIWWMPSGEGFALVNDFWAGTVRYFKCGERDPDWLKGVDSSD